MWEKELQEAIKAGLLAGKTIMDYYRKGFDIEIKSDDSPVTNADKEADKIIKEYLSKQFPEYAFLTEESEDDKHRLENDYVWIVDPVDGTKDFIARDDEFTTNIALAYKHEIVVGVILIPARNEVYYASKGQGTWYLRVGELPVQCHVNDKLEDLTVLTSVFHMTEIEKQLIAKHNDKIKHIEKKGSALKACLIAKGEAELSYRMSAGTKEWDTAASTIVMLEAGGVFVEPDGKEMIYNREDVYNRKGYVMCNRKENILL